MPRADDSTRLTLCLIACVVALWCYTLGKADAREDMAREARQHAEK